MDQPDPQFELGDRFKLTEKGYDTDGKIVTITDMDYNDDQGSIYRTNLKPSNDHNYDWKYELRFEDGEIFETNFPEEYMIEDFIPEHMRLIKS